MVVFAVKPAPVQDVVGLDAVGDAGIKVHRQHEMNDALVPFGGGVIGQNTAQQVTGINVVRQMKLRQRQIFSLPARSPGQPG
jgi:hypothetical protein